MFLRFYGGRAPRNRCQIGHPGVILASCWGSWGQLGAKMGQHGVKMDQRGSKMDQHGAKMDQHGAKIGQHGAKMDQHGAKMGQNGPKMGQYDSNMRQQGSHFGGSWGVLGPRWANLAPGWANLAPKRLKTPPEGPPRPILNKFGQLFWTIFDSFLENFGVRSVPFSLCSVCLVSRFRRVPDLMLLALSHKYPNNNTHTSDN